MLATILSELNHRSEAILVSSVLSNDGLALASVASSASSPAIDEDNLGAMSSALMALGHKTAAELVGDGLGQVLVAGKAGSVLMTQAGPEAILTVVCKPEAESGAILGHMQRAANDIEALVSARRA
ncbi:hypothetical protein SAMN02949497_4344 [Methylomagnum ishizawai]|uniref:Roadblock/LAMTOR2 domain-containing protein n=1 Tax=Methylomagnum ishizawai TaxID=1760988 RepID=A0A1Y6D3D9_9GAMM|nr:roadblock/LC7 domain-containing protein [Methylomagnum ishizawai]SMF96930.1 hypothetical protein SAMN02949497_4344 [Methylomagnum ishizawai]